MKQVQIDIELFCDLYEYFCENHAEGDVTSDIWKALDDKMDKLIAHALFTKYKRAATPSEREAARKEYLKHRGVSSKFMTEEEQHGL